MMGVVLLVAAVVVIVGLLVVPVVVVFGGVEVDMEVDVDGSVVVILPSI